MKVFRIRQVSLRGAFAVHMCPSASQPRLLYLHLASELCESKFLKRKTNSMFGRDLKPAIRSISAYFAKEFCHAKPRLKHVEVQ